jgi:hypothetical protein
MVDSASGKEGKERRHGSATTLAAKIKYAAAPLFTTGERINRAS